jgi:aldehyde:ferredoxin oxidoreductase
MKGYAGKILRVNMTNGELTGTGVGAKILYDEVPPESEWSDPVNRVFIGSGPLGGTSVGGSGTISVVTKGALTGGSTSVQANGLFGAYMRFSGYDGIIIQGAAENWQYLVLKDGEKELRNADKFLGLDTYEVCDALRQEHGEKGRGASVLSIAIGPAGETLVRWAGVFTDKGHSGSHNGPGAVLGSKRLKAIIAFRGQGGIEVVDPEGLRDVAQKMYEDVEWFRGTVGGVENSYKSGRGTVPIKNYTTNIWDITDNRLDSFGEASIREHYQVGREPCWGCRLMHCAWMDVKKGPYKGIVEEPEYEQLAAWGPAIGQDDIEAALMLSAYTDRLGFENNEAGWLVGWVMECFERGFLTSEDLGMEAHWGDIEAVKNLLKMTAERQGFGDILAEGLKRASEKVGGEAADAAIYTMKGNTPRGHDHRTRWAEMFDTCVSNTGTIETHTSVMSPDVQGPENPMKISTEVAETKGLMQFEDSLGTCRFNTRMNAELLAKAISASTGWDFTAEEGHRAGRRAVNLMRAFNIRVGIDAELDRPSARYGSTPVDGPTAGISIMPYWDAMLKNYYKLMGWNTETGVPLKETLKGLGLEHVIEDLYGS